MKGEFLADLRTGLYLPGSTLDPPIPARSAKGRLRFRRELMQQESNLKEPRRLLLSGTFLNSDSLTRKLSS